MAISDAQSGRAGPSRGFAWSNPGLLWFVLGVLAPLPLFWFGLVNLAQEWATPEYSHGPLIPLLSGYMFMREMAMMPPSAQPVRDRGPGFFVVALALGLAAFGNLVKIPDIVFYAMIIWVMGLVLTCFGFRRGMFFWPSVLHLVFMLPLPTFIEWQVTTTLQFISSEIGVWLVAAAGIPVYLDGNIIDLGVYKLQVAEACSGLRYLFPIMSFSYIFCVLYRGPRFHKAALLLAAVPLAVLMNSFRIGMIGILVDNYGIEQAEGFLHMFEGWVIFGACIALLFGLAKLLQKLSGDTRPLSVALDLDFVSLGPQFRRAQDIVPSRPLIAVAALSVATSLAWFAAPQAQPAEVGRKDFALFPMQMADWVGVRGAPLEPEIERVLAADDYISANFRAPGKSAPVDLWMAYYKKQTQGQAIHSPEVCLPGGGWEMFDIEPTEITLPESTGFPPFHLNRAIIQKGESQQLVYYWFEQAGRRLTNDFVAKGWVVWDSATRGRTDGALVRLVTPIVPQQGVEAADARLQGFLADMMPRLGAYIPE